MAVKVFFYQMIRYNVEQAAQLSNLPNVYITKIKSENHGYMLMRGNFKNLCFLKDKKLQKLCNKSYTPFNYLIHTVPINRLFTEGFRLLLKKLIHR